MAIHITATMHRDTIEELLGQLLPLTVPLDPKKPRWLQIGRPDRVRFIEGVGLQVGTSARVQWTVAGVALPFVIRSIDLLIRPEIAPDPLGGKLVFRVYVEDADLKGVPAAIDQGIVAKVNEKLAAVGDKIGWDFGKTLRRSFGLPESMRPADAFQMRAEEAAVEVGRDVLRVSLYLPARFRRVGEE
ncbi:MAG: hypothetical protein NVS3B10_14650 [Polyangiales bacterium]